MPALACLPTRDMTSAEMQCCKKMVVDCHMGPEHHPCCNMRLTAPPQLATVINSSRFQTTVVFVSAIVPARFIAISDRHVTYAKQGLPPPAPPGLHSIIRL